MLGANRDSQVMDRESGGATIDTILRIFMAFVGTSIIGGAALVAVTAGGWAYGLLPMVLVGALLIVLSAFFDRIEGQIRCPGLSIPVGRRAPQVDAVTGPTHRPQLVDASDRSAPESSSPAALEPTSTGAGQPS